MIWLKFILVTSLLLGVGLVTSFFKADLPKAEIDAKYSNRQSQLFMTENRARVHFRDEGRSNGLPLLLVHGSNASLHTWEPWVRLLADEFRLISLDLPAHGLTGEVPDGRYDMEAFMATIDALRAHLALKQFVFIGNSMGGGIAWRYTLAHPQRVIALVLIDATGPPAWHLEQSVMAEAEQGQTPLAYQLLQQAWFRSLARYLDPAALVREGVLTAYHPSAVVTKELVQRYYELALRSGTRDATIQRFASYRADQHIDYDLRRIKTPTLILWGREDALIPVETATQFQNLLPNAQLIIYEQVGHMAMEEIPEKSAADLRTFLNALNSLEL